MSADSQISELLDRWEELRERGQAVSVEQLCRDCPELASELERQIKALTAVDGVLATELDSSQQATQHDDTPHKAAPWSFRSEGRSVILPGYEILGELGQGGMGIVYKAQQTKLHRTVALKMIRGDLAQRDDFVRFESEARAMALMQHPNIVQIYEVGEHDGRHYLALEYVDGGTLEDRLNGIPMAPAAAASLVKTLATGLQAAHDRGIIHRDLKPANILLTADGTPKIADFGLAKRLDGQGVRTRTGVVMGTPSYMAPEQALGLKRELSPSADIYALGAILYELLTGRPPFLGETPLETLDQLCNAEPVAPRQLQPKVPADLETICLQCLRKAPRRRYASSRALAEDLQRFLDHEPILGRAVSRRERLWRWCRRKPSQAALVAVSTLAVLLLLGGGLWFGRELELELERTQQAREEALASEAAIRQGLTRQVAEGLDSNLRRLAAVPQTMATLLGQRSDWQERQLEAWMKALLTERQHIFGMCVAFEPFEMANAPDFALYVYRKDNGFHTKQLIPPSYLPNYRDWSWYQLRSAWGEPYVGPGADDTPMVSYSVPFQRNGKFAGVVSIDLALEFFSSLHDDLEHVHLGWHSYCFVVSPKGTILYHPDPNYEFPEKTANIARIQPDSSFLNLLKRFDTEEAGSGEAIDFTTRQPATFLFARVPAAGWTFVAVVPKPPTR